MLYPNSNNIKVNYYHEVPYFSRDQKNTVMKRMFLEFTTRGQNNQCTERHTRHSQYPQQLKPSQAMAPVAVGLYQIL
jgi:hypothetical protein